jgi:hypothetical protein
VIDLLEELDVIRDRAKRTRESLENGRALTGISGLVQIEKRAEDAIRHAKSLQSDAAALTGQSEQLARKTRQRATTRR